MNHENIEDVWPDDFLEAMMIGDAEFVASDCGNRRGC